MRRGWMHMMRTARLPPHASSRMYCGTCASTCSTLLDTPIVELKVWRPHVAIPRLFPGWLEVGTVSAYSAILFKMQQYGPLQEKAQHHGMVQQELRRVVELIGRACVVLPQPVSPAMSTT